MPLVDNKFNSNYFRQSILSKSISNNMVFLISNLTCIQHKVWLFGLCNIVSKIRIKQWNRWKSTQRSKLKETIHVGNKKEPCFFNFFPGFPAFINHSKLTWITVPKQVKLRLQYILPTNISIILDLSLYTVSNSWLSLHKNYKPQV